MVLIRSEHADLIACAVIMLLDYLVDDGAISPHILFLNCKKLLHELEPKAERIGI